LYEQWKLINIIQILLWLHEKDLEIVGKSHHALMWYLQIIFPNMDVIKLLLECGAPVNARNESRSTPLHVAANPYNFYSPVST